MIYYIKDYIGDRLRTNYGWIKATEKLMKGEKYLKFETRKDADKFIHEFL